MRVPALLAIVLAAGAAAGPAAGASLTPVADAYVTAVRPHASFGTSGTLRVAGRPAAVTYLRFAVTVPAGSSVSSATLQLYATSVSTAGLRVYPVASTTWRERTIDWANAPPAGSRAAAFSGSHRGGTYVSVDVTPLVTHGGPVSLALRAVSASSSSFRSREAATGRPRLVVVTAAAPGGGGGATGPCGTSTSPRTVDHVIWIWMENKPYDSVVGSPAAPFENQLAGSCGLGTNYHGVAHPSLPNYIAATSGDTQGITDDEPPSAHPLAAASIYSQLKAAGKTWRDYEESAPGNCPLASSGTYAVKHDPAAYYTGIRSDCASWDVPLGSTAGGNLLSDLKGGTLPAFSFVTPDLCSDTHDCSVATGDAWLSSWFAQILTSPSYLAGDTVVFVVWDEDDGSATNHVPLLVVSPSTAPATQAGAFFDHYSLLRTTEQLLGLPPLGHAGDAGTASMLAAFNLG
jgi:hypothetical protein